MGRMVAERVERTGAGLPDVRLPAFEGPLDLLLHLVRAGRMDIFDLPIARLCDQYLGVLRSMEELDLAVAGEFLVMAATLLEIKSRMLLPRPPRETSEDEAEAGQDPRAELALRLAEYARYQGMADLLQGRE
ncbi:MAG: segregation and condensation protein A, partial [Armatimonadota bacterium]